MKKMISGLLLLVCMLSTVPVQASEIQPDTLAEIKTLGIMNGYEDGEFHPERTITRAEMAQIAVNIQFTEEERNQLLSDIQQSKLSEYSFRDVSSSHWAYVPIVYLSMSDSVSGYEDGTYRPDENVTYQEAITILLNILGYGYSANKNGGWPDGYLKYAAETGLTKGIEFNPADNALRGDVAVMALNAFDIPMMALVSYNANGNMEFEPSPEDTFRKWRWAE